MENQAEHKKRDDLTEDIAAQAAEELESRNAEKQALIEKNARSFGMMKAAIGSLGLFLGYFVFPQTFFMVFSQEAVDSSGMIKLLASFMGFFVYFFFLISYYIKRTRKSGESVGDILRMYPRELQLKPVLLCTLLGVSLNLSIGALLELLPIPAQLIESYSAGSESLVYADSLAFSIVYISLLAPLCEELMFRGFMYHRMRTAFSVRISVIVVSAAFALPHIDILWVLVAAANSVVFTLVREKYNNILYSIILHCFYNLVSVPMILLLDTGIYTILFDNIAAELIYLLLGGAAVYYCIRRLLDNNSDDGGISYRIFSRSEKPQDEGVTQ